MAFLGDLHPPDFGLDEAREVMCQSWKKLQRLNVKMVYPAHGNPFQIDDVKRSLVVCCAKISLFVVRCEGDKNVA